MELSSEIINYSAFSLPLIVALCSLLLKGDTPQLQLARVVIPAFCGVLAVGFGLQGLVRGCFDQVPICPGGFSVMPVIGNAFGSQIDCMVCLPAAGSLAYTLNATRPYAVIIVAIVACQLSAFAIIQFARWVKKSAMPSK